MFQNLGCALALLRRLKNLSQKEVAIRAGIGKCRLSRYESGKDSPKLDSLAKILKVLGTDLEQLGLILAFLDRTAADGPRLPSPQSPRLLMMLSIGSAMDGALESVTSAQTHLLTLRDLAWEMALDGTP